MLDKIAMMEPLHEKLSVSKQCELLNLSRSSYYRKDRCTGKSEYNLKLMQLLDEEYTRHPFCGSRKLIRYLKDQKYTVNRKRVQRLMKLMGIRSVAPSSDTSKLAPQHKVYPYLLRDVDVARANQVWCTDITYSVPGVQVKRGCLNEPRVYLKYECNEAGILIVGIGGR